MHSRKDHDQVGKSLPVVWIDEVLGTLNSCYENELLKYENEFEIAAQLFSDEIVVAVCLISKENPDGAAITYSVSADVLEQVPPKPLLKAIIDSIGIFFDHYFKEDEENISDHMTSSWQELKILKQALYYRVSRENIRLTLMADKLLEN